MKQRFTIILEGDDDVTPVVIRLRHALKLLLRAFGLKCVRIEPGASQPPREKTIPQRNGVA